MDPNANVRERIEIARRIILGTHTSSDSSRFTELANAYYHWRCNGGVAADRELVDKLTTFNIYGNVA